MARRCDENLKHNMVIRPHQPYNTNERPFFHVEAFENAHKCMQRMCVSRGTGHHGFSSRTGVHENRAVRYHCPAHAPSCPRQHDTVICLWVYPCCLHRTRQCRHWTSCVSCWFERRFRDGGNFHVFAMHGSDLAKSRDIWLVRLLQ